MRESLCIVSELRASDQGSWCEVTWSMLTSNSDCYIDRLSKTRVIITTCVTSLSWPRPLFPARIRHWAQVNMLDRVWQSICEGDAECLGLKPDQVFSRYEIPLVVPMLLCLTFEDIIQAFATFHDNIIEEWKLELASVIKQKTCLGTGEVRHPSLKDDISGDPDTSKVNLTVSE